MINLHYNFKKLEATQALKDHLAKKSKKFEKYVTYPMEVHFFLSVDKPNHIAEIACHAEHKQLVAVAKSKDLYESIDLVVAKIETQLKREREKHKGHQKAHKLSRAAGARMGTDLPAELPHRQKNGRKVAKAV